METLPRYSPVLVKKQVLFLKLIPQPMVSFVVNVGSHLSPLSPLTATSSDTGDASLATTSSALHFGLADFLRLLPRW